LFGAPALDAALDGLDLLEAEIESAGHDASSAPERSALRAAIEAARPHVGADWGKTYTALHALTASAARLKPPPAERHARHARYGSTSWAELTGRGLARWVDELCAL